MNRLFTDPTATAIARIEPVAGGNFEGRVTFTQFGSTVVVRANFIGLAPNRAYGLHIHEKGDCRSADGVAAGGHFNPGGAVHGQPGRGAQHAGDLPNVQTLAEGAVFYAFETGAISVAGGPLNVVGRSVIISRDADDYRTEPDGRSGPPLGCGVIRPG